MKTVLLVLTVCGITLQSCSGSRCTATPDYINSSHFDPTFEPGSIWKINSGLGVPDPLVTPSSIGLDPLYKESAGEDENHEKLYKIDAKVKSFGSEFYAKGARYYSLKASKVKIRKFDDLDTYLSRVFPNIWRKKNQVIESAYDSTRCQLYVPMELAFAEEIEYQSYSENRAKLNYANLVDAGGSSEETLKRSSHGQGLMCYKYRLRPLVIKNHVPVIDNVTVYPEPAIDEKAKTIKVPPGYTIKVKMICGPDANCGCKVILKTWQGDKELSSCGPGDNNCNNTESELTLTAPSEGDIKTTYDVVLHQFSWVKCGIHQPWEKKYPIPGIQRISRFEAVAVGVAGVLRIEVSWK